MPRRPGSHQGISYLLTWSGVVMLSIFIYSHWFNRRVYSDQSERLMGLQQNNLLKWRSGMKSPQVCVSPVTHHPLLLQGSSPEPSEHLRNTSRTTKTALLRTRKNQIREEAACWRSPRHPSFPPVAGGGGPEWTFLVTMETGLLLLLGLISFLLGSRAVSFNEL